MVFLTVQPAELAEIVILPARTRRLGPRRKGVDLRRQQERGLVQKARRLMDENSVSFQMFPILLSSITLGSESQIPVFKEGQSNT